MYKNFGAVLILLFQNYWIKKKLQIQEEQFMLPQLVECYTWVHPEVTGSNIDQGNLLFLLSTNLPVSCLNSDDLRISSDKVEPLQYKIHGLR